MDQVNRQMNTAVLAYFSGTGCTKQAADCLEKELLKQGLQVQQINIAEQESYHNRADLLIVLSPVYAFRLAEITEKWTKKLPHADGTPAAVIAVSGAGEISPNTACRVKCKHILKTKGYDVIYETMIVMPSNFTIQAEQQLNLDLLHILPQKVSRIVSEIMTGKKVSLKPKLQDRVFSVLGKAEHLGAAVFGSSIHASQDCSQCGKCVRSCPEKNIRMVNGRPKFGFHCLLCMKCIYSCPCKALSPRILKFAVLKNGFDLRQMMDMEKAKTEHLQKRYPKNLLWQGAIDYLQGK